jgi:flagellar basal body-associated protein FliL
MQQNSRGFAHLILILALVVIAVVGLAGYYVVSSSNKDSAETTTDTTQVVPEKIDSNQDLEQASKALDADQNKSDLDPAQLDADLNSLL